MGIQMVPTATPTMVETAVPMMQPMQMGAPAVSAMPMMGSAMATPAAAMQGIGGFGTQAVSAMPVGGSAFGTQSMPSVPYLMRSCGLGESSLCDQCVGNQMGFSDGV